jgi:hypothetical protein
MGAVPFTFTGVVALCAGVSWVIERRMKLQPGKHDAGSQDHKEKEGPNG